MTEQRINKIQKILPSDTAAIITSGANRFYLTGFETSSGMVVATSDAAYFLVDFRYVEKARAVITDMPVKLSSDHLANANDILKEHNIKNVLVETESTSMATLKAYSERLEGVIVLGDNTLDETLRDMRAVKSEYELSLIKKAQDFTDKTFTYICERIAEGRTEREVMLDMEFYMRGLGSEGVSFDFIVVSGKNSSLPHGVPTNKKIQKGDFITMDFGAVSEGYRSDMTRTVAVGSVSDEQRHIYDTVLRAQTAAIDAVKAGLVCRDIDKIARDIIAGEGYGDCFGHGLGHSVGIEIHEMPAFNTRCETILKHGTVMTVEPGIYLEDKFGVRIEDMVYVTEKGCINITNSPKNLIIL